MQGRLMIESWILFTFREKVSINPTTHRERSMAAHVALNEALLMCGLHHASCKGNAEENWQSLTHPERRYRSDCGCEFSSAFALRLLNCPAW